MIDRRIEVCRTRINILKAFLADNYNVSLWGAVYLAEAALRLHSPEIAENDLRRADSIFAELTSQQPQQEGEKNVLV